MNMAQSFFSGMLASLRTFGSAVRCIALSALLLCGISTINVDAARAQGVSEAYSISSVVIQGNRRIDTDAIKSLIKASSGRVTSEQIAQDVKTLYNAGFFDQVLVSFGTGPGGTPVLIYTVKEKPVARKLFVKGNKEVSEGDLVDILKLEGRRFVDKSKVQGLVRKGVSYYQSQGFYDAEIDYTLAPVSDNEVDVTFNVKEGKRYRVREVTLRGVQELDEDEMRSKIQIQRYKWWSSWIFGTGRVNQEMMEGDKQLLRQYLVDHGFLEGTVGEASVEKREDGLYVVFDITEGNQYTIGKITAGGDLIDGSQEKTLDDIDSEVGEVFSASKVRNDIFTITDKFADQGYAFANVVPNTNLNKADKTVDVEFQSAKGNLVRVNRINITGNEKTYDNVIRRDLKVQEQQLYSSSKIKRSQTVLQRRGYFDEVNISNAPTSDPSKVDLDVNVKEATTGSFSAGAGFSTNSGVLFNTRVSENNLFGTGRRANLNIDVGNQINNQILSIDDPRVNDSNFSWGVDLMRTERWFVDFDRQLTGGSTTVGYPGEGLGEWAEDISFNLKYELVEVNINDVDEDAAQLVKDSEGQSTSSSITPSIIRNTINNPLNPTKGSKQVLSFEYAGLGGDQEFHLFEIRNSWFYPLFESEWGDIVISDRTSFAYGQSDNDDPFPLFRRFFPGGINSVRGYRFRRLGPKDENGHEYGGAKQLVNNAEIIFPLINSAGFKGVLFYDAGQAFDDDEQIQISELRVGWGYGIRWASPLGPIRVEIGYPVNPQEGEKSPVTMFSFGAPF
jgi:outer membrane protein insertion porin family